MTERDSLTERQREVLDFIEAKIARDGYPPTIREIGDHMRIRSTNGVSDHLKALQRKGFLSRTESKSRACVPLQPSRAGVTAPTGPSSGYAPGSSGPSSGYAPGSSGPTLSSSAPGPSLVGRGRLQGRPELTPVLTDEQPIDVPVRGRIAAGVPIAALESREDTVRIDRFFLGKSKDVFALRVVGQSMIEDGIHDGDFIFVRKQQTAPRGAIVVAMIEGEATVKRYFHEGHRVRFQPANSAMQPIYVAASEFRETQIVGVVVGIYRTMD
jgi:repressor LexA